MEEVCVQPVGGELGEETMIRIQQKNRAKNRIPIAERTMPQMKQFVYDFDPLDVGDDEEAIIEAFELLYEAEYKYHMVKNNEFSGTDRRRQGVLHTLEEAGRIAVDFLSHTFREVFGEWLRKHAITNPEQWAEARFYEDGFTSIVDDMGVEGALEAFEAELIRYSPKKDIRDLVIETYNADPSIINNDFLDDFVRDVRFKLEKGSPVAVEDYFDIVLETGTEEEVHEFLNTYVNGYDEDFFRLMGSEQKAFQFIIEQFEESDLYDTLELLVSNIDKFFLIAYKNIMFPAWYAFWSKQGIDKTRARVEDVYEKLQKIGSYPIEKQFMIINIAKNTNHQSGSMMEYYEETWGVDYRELERLSNMDTTEWDSELREIGVRM